MSAGEKHTQPRESPYAVLCRHHKRTLLPRIVRALNRERSAQQRAAEQLTANQAGFIAVGEPTIEKGLDKALTGAVKVVKRTVEATTDGLTSELQEALKS